MLRFCPNCRHYREAIETFANDQANEFSAGEIGAGRSEIEKKERQRHEEQRRFEEGLPFHFEPECYNWCERFTPSESLIEELTERAESSDLDLEAANAIKRELEVDFLIDPAHGSISPVYALCSRQNPHADCRAYEPIWRVVGASVVGISHVTEGLPCQDAHATRTVNGKWVIIAVSDGAGSAKHSDVGSKLAARTAVNTVAKRLSQAIDRNRLPVDAESWRELFTPALVTAFERLNAEADERTIALRDLACTLVLAVSGPGCTATIHVGDGACVAQWTDGTLETLTSAPAGDEFLELTTFLISDNATEEAQVTCTSRTAHGLAAFSDGLELMLLKYPQWEPSDSALNPFFSFWERATERRAAVGELEGFLESEKVRQRTYDDVTLVLATQEPFATAAAAEPPEQSESDVQEETV